MRLIKPLFFYLILTAFSLRGAKINQAYEALSIYDYFKAKKLFYEVLKKQPNAPAAYGLSTLFYRSDNPFSNADSAAKYITWAGNFFKKSRVKESYNGFIIDSLHISILADSIAQKLLKKALLANNTSDLEAFLIKNPFAPQNLKQQALLKRDQLIFSQNQYYNNSDSTYSVLLRFPQSHLYPELQTLYDKQLFEEYTVLKSAQVYIDFIRQYPTNKFIGKAQDDLFQLYRKNNDVQGLEFYVHNYPKSRFYNEAWKLLYALTVKSYNNDELTGFMNAYPEFPFKESINKEIELNNKILIPLNDSDYVGFIDTSGVFVIPATYDAATPFKEGVAVVTRNDSAWFVNKENKNVFNSFYTEAFPFISGIAPVNKNGQWFLINRQGQEIAGPFDDLSEQSEQIYTVKLNNKYGALDIYGNYILQPRFDKLGDFKNGKAYYIDNGLYGFITKSGKTFSARYQWISDFDENNIAIVKMNGLYGLINDSDSLFLNARYELILKAEHSNFILVRNNKYGFYSSKNCFITDVDNEFKKELPVSYYTNGLAFKLIKNKKQAIMDANGKVSIEFGMFDEVYFAQNNLIRIKKKNKYGFTDRKLNIVIPCKYLEATDFKDSISIVKTKTETVLISTAGTEVFKTKGSLTRIFAHYFWVEEEEQNLLIDNKGKVLIENASGYSMVNLQQNDNAATYLIIELENKSKKIIKL